MKVLFYLLDGNTNASSWHRALQYFPLLREHGIEPSASFPVPNPLYRRLVERGPFDSRAKAQFYGLFLFRRLAAVLSAGGYDAVVIQRDLFPFGPPLLERLLRRVNPHLIYDTDDATYLRPSFTPDTLFQRFRSFDKAAEVVRHARWSAVATDEIAAWARQHSARVDVVPMAVDPEPYRHAASARTASQDGPVVLGWAGTGGGVRYLEDLQPALLDVARRHEVLVRVVSGAADRVQLPCVPVERVPWRADRHLADLATFDVGLVPLHDSPFERAKFPFKLLQYLALGVAPVAARVGTATQVIQHGENGLLAGSHQEWVDALERLVLDTAARRRIGQAGPATVEASYTIQRVGPRLAAGIQGATRD